MIKFDPKSVIIACGRLTYRMADSLRPLVGDAVAASLKIRRDDELDLGTLIESAQTTLPTRQRLTLHSWGKHGKHFQGMLQKYLRIPSSVRAVVIEEKVWHALSTTPPPGDVIEGLRSLLRRGDGVLFVLDEPNQQRVIAYDMERSIYKVMEDLSWIEHHKKGVKWLIKEHSFTHMEAWWWLYLMQPEVRARLAASQNIELVIFS